MMRRAWSFGPGLRKALGLGLGLGLVLCGAFAQSAKAQDPDTRTIRPNVILLVDTSGSMERVAGRACTTPGCENTLPTCAAGTYERNRWALTIEALTGSFASFTCRAQSRLIPNPPFWDYTGEYDEDYFIPHYEFASLSGGQTADGVLDVYRTRARFGLMTFDAKPTLNNTTLWPQGSCALNGTCCTTDPTAFNFCSTQVTSNAANGMFSYGENRPLFFPGCTTTYGLNIGARSSVIDTRNVGRLVSVGSEGDDYDFINTNIQNTLLQTRPYGGTPIAAQLDDLRYYMQTAPNVQPKVTAADAGDPYYACRDSFAVLVTDGAPDSDFRGAPFNCDTPGYTCPYDTAPNIASDLCRYNTSLGKCMGSLDGVYVVGFDVDAQAKTKLGTIANSGGTCRDSTTGNIADCAYYANDRSSLMNAMSAVLDRASTTTTTRTAPVFAPPGSTQGQFQFETGYNLGNTNTPWSGRLTRVRYVCDSSTLTPVRQDPTSSMNDYFHDLLNTRNVGSSPSFTGGRSLYTVIPTSSATQQTIIGQYAGENLEPFARSNPYLSPTILSVTASNPSLGRDCLIDWVHGIDNSVWCSATPAGKTMLARSRNRLGDIYHSTPAIIGSPKDNAVDDAYNLFRIQPIVATRPPVLYVGTNDGIMHAFSIDHDATPPGATSFTYSAKGLTIPEGTELWGFVPPMLLSRMESASVSHQDMADGTPVVKDVVFGRVPGSTPTATMYHTVLVAGLRAGGRAYYSLEVTDPTAPQFLWQITDPEMGETYAKPAVGLARVNFAGVSQVRGIAVLPGGRGQLDPDEGSGVCNAVAGSLVQQNAGIGPLSDSPARTTRHCWTGPDRTAGSTPPLPAYGRVLLVVDIETGGVLARFGSDQLSSPMTGSAVLVSNGVGEVTDAAFMGDADGLVWRLDMSSEDPTNWRLWPVYDMYADQPGNLSQPIYNEPAIARGPNGEYVIIQGTGDIDRLDSTAANRVVAFTEREWYDGGRIRLTDTRTRWTKQLQAGELVTGAIQLIQGKVYFSTFLSSPDPLNMCNFGEGRLWGLEYYNNDGGSPPGPLPALAYPTPTSPLVQNVAFPNQIVNGVSLTQTARCIESTLDPDPYMGGLRSHITRAGGGQYQIVAQVSGNSAVRLTGSQVATLSVQLPTPASVTRIIGQSTVD